MLLQTKLGFLQQPSLSIRERSKIRERDILIYLQIGITESFDRSLFLSG